jgi:hypothetical protein
MTMESASFVSRSGQFTYHADADLNILFCQFNDFTKADINEFLQFVGAMGDEMRVRNSGKMAMDISQMRGFDIPKRVAVIKNLPSIFLNKIPFLALGVVSGKSMFENATMQLAIAACKPLSKKFQASEMFSKKEDVVAWLCNYKDRREEVIENPGSHR